MKIFKMAKSFFGSATHPFKITSTAAKRNICGTSEKFQLAPAFLCHVLCNLISFAFALLWRRGRSRLELRTELHL